MSSLEVARSAAEALGMLDADAALRPLDSMDVVDLVVELERLTKREIPSTALHKDVFASLDTIAAMLDRVASDAA